MIVTLEEVLCYLRLERDELTPAELDEVSGLMAAAELCLYNATGVSYDSGNALAKLFCRMLICDWYDGRGTPGRIGDGARGLLAQLTYCQGDDV